MSKRKREEAGKANSGRYKERKSERERERERSTVFTQEWEEMLFMFLLFLPSNFFSFEAAAKLFPVKK